jgi:glycerate 2-kinase
VTLMRVVLAPDKFKGCLSAAEVAAALRNGLLRARPDLEVECRPIADGGEGTIDAVVSAGFSRVPDRVQGPTGEGVMASYARRDGVAIVEMAEASGLARLPGGRRAALTASTYGTGELIQSAVRSGCNDLVIGLGGSATTEGGTGLLRALGVRFLDSAGTELADGGAALRHLERIDASGLDPALKDVSFTVASDVAVPLCGPTGAAAMFGPQKGASPEDVAVLEAGLARLANVMADHLGVDHSTRAGAGAAGGTGFALMSMLGASIRPGVDVVLDAVGFDEVVAGAQLVVTGEGAVDEQTLQGKAPMGVLRRALAAGAEVALVGGRIDVSASALRDYGFAEAWSLSELAEKPSDSFDRAAELLHRIGQSIAFRFSESAPVTNG